MPEIIDEFGKFHLNSLISVKSSLSAIMSYGNWKCHLQLCLWQAACKSPLMGQDVCF